MPRLDPELEAILREITRSAETRERERVRPELAGAIRRGGLRTPEVTQIRTREAGRTGEDIRRVLTDLLLQQYGEKREERLVGEERAYREKRTRAQWAEEARRGRLARREYKADVAGARRYEKGRLREARGYAEQRAGEERERARKGAWQRLLTGVVGGAVTGGIMPAAMGAGGRGLGRIGLGALRGGILGGETAGQLAGYRIQPREDRDYGEYDPLLRGRRRSIGGRY